MKNLKLSLLFCIGLSSFAASGQNGKVQLPSFNSIGFSDDSSNDVDDIEDLISEEDDENERELPSRSVHGLASFGSSPLKSKKTANLGLDIFYTHKIRSTIAIGAGIFGGYAKYTDGIISSNLDYKSGFNFGPVLVLLFNLSNRFDLLTKFKFKFGKDRAIADGTEFDKLNLYSGNILSINANFYVNEDRTMYLTGGLLASYSRHAHASNQKALPSGKFTDAKFSLNAGINIGAGYVYKF